MCKKSSVIVSRFLVAAVLIAMLTALMLPIAALGAESGTASVSTTTGSTENYRYFKEDTGYDMSYKVNTPMTIEFELAGCGSIAGANPGGVIVGNYSEDAATYINVEVAEWGLIRVRGRYNSGSEWTANFYASENADIRLNGVHHYAITIGSGWTGVSLYVDGVHKATRYPASLTLPNASEYTHPFRIGGDYRSGNTNYFKGLIYSVAMYNDIRSASEIKSDTARTKSWSNSDGLMAAYDITRMGEAALRDYSGNGNVLVYNNGSGIQVENFGKYEIDQNLTSNIETFEAWIYMPKSLDSKTIGGTIIGNYRSYNGARVMLEIYLKGNPRLSYTNAEGKTSYHRFTDVDLRTGTWQHLAIVHDTASGEARCYVNGELKQTLTENVLGYSDKVLDQKFLIGRDTALRYAEGDGEYWDNRKDQYFRGFIKEVRLYSDVRSEGEISADYSGALDTSELIAAYQIDPEDAYTNLTDLSGNGYDANYKQLLWEREYVEPVGDYAYSFAIVGDTQTVNDQNPELLKNIYQWIVNNKDAKNIQYVIGLGDITELGVDEGHANYTESESNQQWIDAKEAITLMDGKLPYSLIRGDGHDGIEMFNKYFASHEPYLDNISGYYEEGRIDNVYHTFKVGEVDYLLLCLDHGTKDDVLVWANEVVASHPDHRVIVTTHQYLQSDGTLSESWESGNASAYDPENNAADELWDKFISKHPNISMVICGHSDVDGVITTKQTGDHGNEVTQILINPQGMDAEYYHGSKGMVAMLYFSTDGQSVQVEYYSTIKGTYYPCDDFTVSYSTDTHSYNATVTAPTCTDAGYTTYTCPVCEYGYVADNTAALGHNEVTTEGKAPTCTTPGLTDGKACSTCGLVSVQQTEIDPLGHKEETLPGRAPTCTAPGLSDGVKCSVCDEILVAQDDVSALGHSYGASVTAPTCTDKGYTTYTCAVCGDSYVSDEAEALGHSYNAVVTDPDCVNGGYTTYTCTVCGYNYVGDEVLALGHSYGSTVTAPTCESAGFTTYTCSACGDTYTADSTSALGHKYVGAQTLAPTCTDKGIETYTCQNDKTHTYTKEIPELGHSYSASVTAPTCTDKGYTTYTCTVCGDSYVSDETSALGHTELTVSGKAPTCTETGLTDGKICTVCGETLVAQNVIPANGHTDLDKNYICDVCGEDLCTDHELTVIPGKAPTCTETGLTDGEICTVCGETLVAQDVIPALGHSYGASVSAPTCTDKGYTTYTCSVCGDSYVADETAALGHNYNAVVTAPDCVNGGYTTYTCTVCGDSYVADETAALGHNYNAVVTAPDCVNGGYTTYTCTVCGDSYVADETPALGHTYTSEVTAPTCTDKGYTTFTCECGDTYTDFELDALGHDFTEATTEAPKTCKACGITEGDKLPAEDNTPDDEPETEPDNTPAEDTDHSECKAENELTGIINLILNFIRNLLGLTEKCVCEEDFKL